MEQNIPLQIVKPREKGDYKLDDEALEKILTQPVLQGRKLCVVSIAGPFRSGKSFLLNFIIQYLSERERGNSIWLNGNVELNKFNFQSGTAADTKGIYLWGRPFIIQSQKHGEVAVLVLDTQGNFDDQTDMNENSMIFAISTLISSVQIYNLMRQVDDSNLQNLRLFTAYGRLAIKDENTSPFQKLIFLIRDFGFTDYGHGEEEGNRYIEAKFRARPDARDENRELRDAIRNCFDTINCFLMPEPGKKINKVVAGSRVSDIDNPEFIQYMKQFVEGLFSDKNITVKENNGVPIFKEQLMDLAKGLMQRCENGELPPAKDLYQATVEASNQAAINSTMAYFDAEWGSLFNKHPNLSDLEELQDIFSQVKNKAMEFFENAPRMKNQKKEEEYRKDIRDRFIVRYLEAKRIVEANRIAKEEAENVQIEVQKREKEKLAYQQAIQKIQQKNTFEQQQLRKEMDLIEEESRKTELELAKKQKELIELQNHMQDATEQQRLQMSHMQQQMELRVAELQLQVNKQKRGFFVKVGDYFENLFS